MNFYLNLISILLNQFFSSLKLIWISNLLIRYQLFYQNNFWYILFYHYHYFNLLELKVILKKILKHYIVLVNIKKINTLQLIYNDHIKEYLFHFLRIFSIWALIFYDPVIYPAIRHDWKLTKFNLYFDLKLDFVPPNLAMTTECTQRCLLTWQKTWNWIDSDLNLIPNL